jgi:hypothetical protein
MNALVRYAKSIKYLIPVFSKHVWETFLLKVHLHEIFYLKWFCQTNPSWLLINVPNIFGFGFTIYSIFRAFRVFSVYLQIRSVYSQYTNRFIPSIQQIRTAKFRSKSYLIPPILSIQYVQFHSAYSENVTEEFKIFRM